MYKKIIQLICLFFLANVGFANSVTNDAAELGKLLQATTSLKANFSQEVYDKKNNAVRKLSGSMALKKPKLFRWQVEKPEKNLIVIDGKKFWNFDVELEQVTVQKIDESYESSPVSLFLAADISDISQRYLVKKLSGVDANNQSKAAFELKSRKKADGFKKVELVFKNKVIDSLVLVDQLEQTSKIQFFNVKTNINLATDLFEFTPPKGVDVVGDK